MSMFEKDDTLFVANDIEFGLVPDAMFDDVSLSRKHNVENYLSLLSIRERDVVNVFAGNIKSDKPLAPVSAIIPIAAHQESARIAPTLAQYAKQQTDEPFSVVLHPNMPVDGDIEQAQDTIDEIEAAKVMYPDLDIRSTELHIVESPKIGQLRRDVWGATILLAYVEGAFDASEEYMGLNHDIDVTHMSPHYMRRVQQYRDKVRAKRKSHGISRDIPLQTMSTQMRHSFDANFPNSSTVASWIDFAHRQAGNASSYDASLVVPFAHYAKSGGFDKSKSTYETSPLRNGGQGIQKIPGTAIHTSPRRYIGRLPYHSTSEIWSEGSFDAYNEYREQDAGSDILPERKDVLIEESLVTTMPHFFRKTFEERSLIEDALRGMSAEESLEIYERKLARRKQLAMKFLKGYAQSSRIAHVVDASYDIHAIARDYTVAFRPVLSRDVE